jgi:microcin C transport system permease protein
MVPTLLGILLVNFVIVQFAPGGPVERAIAQASGLGSDVTARVSGSAGEGAQTAVVAESSSRYQGAQGLDPAFIAELEKQFGFDKPAHVRFMSMLGNYARFDFGESFYRGSSVIDLIAEKLPVSLSLGLWTTLIVYLISIPLGIRKCFSPVDRTGRSFRCEDSFPMTGKRLIGVHAFSIISGTSRCPSSRCPSADLPP